MSDVFKSADILMPTCDNMEKWAVVACDQYTSEPEYWSAVEETVKDAPSALNLMLPEIYLECDDVDKRIENIKNAMKDYIDSGVLKETGDTYIYVERTLKDGTVRCGIVGMIDLEHYDYNKGSKSMVRPTEGTILSRIPPRVKVREGALIEMPHIMLLIDDDKKSIIEPLGAKKDTFKKVYDFDLMMDSGHISGYVLEKDAISEIDAKLDKLCDIDEFNKKYGVDEKNVLLFAVGDGNHSLATAKACYENLKNEIGDKALSSPARYALAEVVNLHSDSLKFEPIHRVVFDVDAALFESELKKYYEISLEGDGQCFKYVTKDTKKVFYIEDPKANLCVGSVQIFIDSFIQKFGGRVDYIHDDDAVYRLAEKDGCVGVLFDVMGKDELFKTVIVDGSLTRKTFSMGHSYDKRFYLESRKIK